MAIETVYYRHKVDGAGWRYSPLSAGRQSDAAKRGPFYIRVKNPAGKYQWQKHESREAANEARITAPVEVKAQSLGLLPDDLTEVASEANKNRTPIKLAVERYKHERRFGRPKSIAAYENTFNQLLANLPRGVRFIDQLAQPAVLNAYVEFLLAEGYAKKTVSIRMQFVFSLLKANGVERSSTLIKLPKVQRTRTKAYNPEELSKLFATMTPEEYLRYLFFVRTGCREQEVQYATWKDLDLKGLRFSVSGEGKGDVVFIPKNHEERRVSLTTELAGLLADHKKHALSDRWIFTNKDGKPDGHFLRKFKIAAQRAGLNCGQCKTTLRTGRYENRKNSDLTCESHPVCEEHYLHRLRKTAATNWLRSGFDLMKIKNWLGHKSLEVTQIYLDAEMHDPDEQKKLDAAGNF